MKSLKMYLDTALEIGLELMSFDDVTSEPSPGDIPSKNEPEPSAATLPAPCLKTRVESWEDEGGRVSPTKESSQSNA